MLEKALFPVDFSRPAGATLEFLKGLKPSGLKLVVLIHVIDARGVEYPVTESYREKLMEKLDEWAGSLREEGLTAKTVVHSGVPFEEILKVAEAEQVSWIVTGSHGKSPLEELLFGSVSERVGRVSRIPVLFIRYGYLEGRSAGAIRNLAEETFRKILFPTDFSACATRALEHIKLLKERIGEVLVTHVIESKAGLEDRALENQRLSASQQLEKISDDLQRSGLKVKMHLAAGTPVAEVLRLAGEEEVSLIIMGSRGKGLIRETFVGSVSLDTIRLANKPVMIVR